MLKGSNSLVMSPTMRSALKRLAANKYRRGPRYWQTPGAADISQHTVTELKLRNMVEIRHGTGRDRVSLTDLGKAVVDEVAAARRRQGATVSPIKSEETVH